MIKIVDLDKSNILRGIFDKYPSIPVAKVVIESNGVKAETQLTVQEAESLLVDIQDLISGYRRA